MKYIISALFILLVIPACQGPETLTAPAEAQHVKTTMSNISPLEAQSRLSNSAAIVLDIRTPEEFAKGHIPGAVLIDYKSNDFDVRLAALDKSKTYIVHCQSGGRSGRSMSKFEKLGFENILHLKSGYRGWQKAGLPIERP